MLVIRVDRRVTGVEEFESGVSFLEFFLDRFFTQRTTFFTKKMLAIRVDRRVIKDGQFEFDVSFFLELTFLLSTGFYAKKNFFKFFFRNRQKFIFL